MWDVLHADPRTGEEVSALPALSEPDVHGHVSSRLGVIFAIIPMVLMLIVFQRIFNAGKDYRAYSGQVQITESKMAFGEDKSGGTVAVMGTIKNNSPIPWKDIRFQVEFHDAEGARSDTGQREEYSYYLPANSSLTFKTSFQMQFPETNYVSHTIFVVFAKDGRTRW